MSRPHRYVTVDVFTDRVFGGNPLAVVLDAEGLTTAQMQSIAAEFNYSETTFVLPARAPEHTANVRIFTPQSELPFAGHPTLGTTFVLRGDSGKNEFVLEETAGAIRVLVGGADQLQVFVRILVKILFATLATELHFLAFINKHKGRAHVAVQLVAGHWAGWEQIRNGVGAGLGDGCKGRAAATRPHGAFGGAGVGRERHDAEGAGGQ